MQPVVMAPKNLSDASHTYDAGHWVVLWHFLAI